MTTRFILLCNSSLNLAVATLTHFPLLPQNIPPVIHTKIRTHLEVALSDSFEEGGWERSEIDIYWNFKFSHVLCPDHKYLHAVIQGWGVDVGNLRVF